MMLVDSHCHLDHLELNNYDNKLEGVLTQAYANNIKHILSVGLTPVQSQTVITIAESFPYISASVGFHPTENITEELTEQALIKLGSHEKVVAIGETGLDFYRTDDPLIKELQIKRFRTHIRASRALNKPLIIHTRNARAETIEILKEENAQEVGGVLHCFTETWEMAETAINDLNFYISFSGIITFKNTLELQALVQKVPLEKLLIETDAPYLAPQPYRGKANYPEYVKYVAQKVAELKNQSLDSIARITTKNFFDCFQLADRSLYVNAIKR